MKTPTVWAAGAVSLICLACAAAAAEKTPGTQEALRKLRALRRSVERIWTVTAGSVIQPVIRGYEKHMAGLTALDLRTLAALRGDVHLTELEKKLAEIAIDRKIRPDLYQRAWAAIERPQESKSRARFMPPLLPIPMKVRASDRPEDYRLVWEELLLRPCSLRKPWSHERASFAAAMRLQAIGHPDSLEVFTMAYRVSLPRPRYKVIRSRLLGLMTSFAKGGDNTATAVFEAAYECYAMTTDPREKAARLTALERVLVLAPEFVERLIKDTQARADLLKRVQALQHKAKAEKAKASR